MAAAYIFGFFETIRLPLFKKTKTDVWAFFLMNSDFGIFLNLGIKATVYLIMPAYNQRYLIFRIKKHHIYINIF